MDYWASLVISSRYSPLAIPTSSCFLWNLELSTSLICHLHLCRLKSIKENSLCLITLSHFLLKERSPSSATSVQPRSFAMVISNVICLFTAMTNLTSVKCAPNPSPSTATYRLTCTNTLGKGLTDAGTVPKDSLSMALSRRTNEHTQERSPFNASFATRRLLRHRT